MGKGKTEIPEAPQYFTDPLYQSGMDKLFGLGGKLTSFDFSGDLSPLKDTININPDVVSGFFSSLQPQLRQLRQGTVNQLAATNQLESSTTANRLGQIDTDIANTLQGHTANLIQQALQNRISLFGTGLNTITGATGMAGQNQAQRNQFNLANYENQVAASLAGKDSKGGLMGGLTGAAGGAMAGSSFGPWGMAIGALAGGAMGALGPSGTGGQLMSSGAGIMGSGLGSNKLPYQPGSTASNNPFLDTESLSVKYPHLFGRLNYN